MTDESALLAAILAYPEDDTPRLVFADWLDENEVSVACERCGGGGLLCDAGGSGHIREFAANDPKLEMYLRYSDDRDCPACDGSGFVSNGYAAKAAFIRIQCELAKHWRGVGRCTCRQLIDKYDCDNCLTWDRTEELRDRERELFASLPLELPDGFFRCVSTVAYSYSRLRSDPLAVYERGFVDSVSCTWEAWRDHGDAILTAQPVRKVTLTSWPEYFTFDNGLKIFHFGSERQQHQFVDLFGRTYGRRDVIERLLKAEWPTVREWELPPDPNMIPDHLQDAASALIASGRMIEGEIIDVPLPPTR